MHMFAALFYFRRLFLPKTSPNALLWREVFSCLYIYYLELRAVSRVTWKALEMGNWKSIKNQHFHISKFKIGSRTSNNIKILNSSFTFVCKLEGIADHLNPHDEIFAVISSRLLPFAKKMNRSVSIALCCSPPTNGLVKRRIQKQIVKIIGVSATWMQMMMVFN